jgi:hypothetical protein
MIRGELFSQDMVKAFLENRKCRTSRPIKPQPELRSGLWFWGAAGWSDGIRSFYPMPCHSMYNRMRHKPGDVIYVRETWSFENVSCKDQYIFKADGWDRSGLKWHPSLHMPREAARLWFRATDVKVQKLDDMTEQDAVEDGFKNTWGKSETPQVALEQFLEFWEHTYGPDTKWMWVYCLQPITKDEALKEAKAE